jgi:hypothetical protein
MTKIQRELKREFPFATVERTRGNHIRIRLPNGRSVITGSTPSCWLAMRKVRAEVRRQMTTDRRDRD